MGRPRKYINQIINGDCMQEINALPQNSIDLVVTDPPYNFHYGGVGWLKKLKRNHLERVIKRFGSNFNPEPLLEELRRVMKRFNGYFWCNKELIDHYIRFARIRRYNFNILVWHKSNPAPLVKNTYLPDTEYCVFIRQKGAFFNSDIRPINTYRKYFITSTQHDTVGHPTVKPLEIMKHHITISSPKGGVILDPFLGSGTTAVAASVLGRRYVGIEKETDYCRIAHNRLKQLNLEI